MGFTIWLFNIANWKIPAINGGFVRWENHLSLWAIYTMAMLNNQRVARKKKGSRHSMNCTETSCIDHDHVAINPKPHLLCHSIINCLPQGLLQHGVFSQLIHPP